MTFKTLPRRPRCALTTPIRAPKTLSEHLQDRPRRLQDFAKAAQETLKINQNRFKNDSTIDLKPKPSWKDLENYRCILEPSWSVLGPSWRCLGNLFQTLPSKNIESPWVSRSFSNVVIIRALSGLGYICVLKAS